MQNKVLIVGMSKQLGGIETFCYNYFLACKDYIEMDFLAWTEIAKEQEIINLGGKVNRLKNKRARNFIKYYLELYKFIKEHKEYTIIHSHLQSASSVAPLIFGKLLGRKVVAHSHSTQLIGRKITKLLNAVNKRIIRLICNRFFACSTQAGDWMFGKKIISSKKFLVIPNSINLKKFTFSKDFRLEIRLKYNILNKIILGNIGRFTKVKNHIFMLELIKDLNKIENKYVLLLIGGGEEEILLKDYVKTNGIENQVIFAGIRQDAYKYLSAMDLFILPSIYEGLPLVLIEAQANRLQCIVSDNVYSEVDYTNTLKFLPLKKDVWVKEITKRLSNIGRVEKNNSYNPYDIEKTKYILIDIYRELALEKNHTR